MGTVSALQDEKVLEMRGHKDADMLNATLDTAVKMVSLYYVHFTTIKSKNFQIYKIHRKVQRLKQPLAQAPAPLPPSAFLSLHLPEPGMYLGRALFSRFYFPSLHPQTSVLSDISQKYILRQEKANCNNNEKNATIIAGRQHENPWQRS